MFYTVSERTDGFGAQFQTIIYCILLAENTGNKYIHNRIKSMEHNYNGDPDYLPKAELLMNISGNYTSIEECDSHENIMLFTPQELIHNFETNMIFLMRSAALINLKTIFWKNKERVFFANNSINVAVHVRRPNSHDNREDGANTNLKYYFDIIERIKNTFTDGKRVTFHIYSQNIISDYSGFNQEGLCFHLNENVFDTFTGLVAADILVTSKSSFSYAAAILSDGLIYYQPFWHPPGENWIVCTS
jgi:hypothetical protein